MSKLLDATICPDCRAALDREQTCTGCSLRLTGPLAVDLWKHMVAADGLVERLRAVPAPAPAPAPASSALSTAGLPVAPPLPHRSSVAGRSRHGVSTLSAQAILLGVGGLCLLVAAAVFVAVTWSALGLTGRTLVMAAITVVMASTAVLLTRRGLRGGAETLWLLTAALITLDLGAARWAGLLGDLDPRHVVGLVGALLLAVGTAASAWVLSTPTRRLAGMVGVSGVGTLLLVGSETWAAEHAAVATAAVVPVLAATALALARVAEGRLRPNAYAVGAVGVLSWLVLLAQGLDRTGTSLAPWWQDMRGWPLLVAALWAGLWAGLRTVPWAVPWAGVPAAVRHLPVPLRYVGATASLVSLVAFALGGTSTPDHEVLLLCAVALALALVTAYLPSVWARPAGVMTAAGGLVALVVTAVRPLDVLTQLPTTGPARGANLAERLAAPDGDLASWTAPVVAAVAALTVLALLRHLPTDTRAAGRVTWLVTAPTVVGLGLTTALLEQRPELLPAVLAWSALIALSAALVHLGRTHPASTAVPLAVAAYLVLLGLRLSVPSHLLVAVLATAVALALAAAAARSGTDRLSGVLVPLLSGAGVLLTGFAAMHWPYVAHATGDTAGLALALVMAAAGMGAAYAARTAAARVTIEATALAGALVAPFLPTDDVVRAVTVTVAGTAVALVAIAHRDRDRLAWLSTALLGTATLMRVVDDAVAPELYAVPAALLLIGAGVRRLQVDPAVASWRVLGSGLTLGLVPSLLLALDEPVSLRGALVAAAGVVALATGVARHWGAPFLAGAAVVAVLAVRHLGPVAAALPRWISLGSVGVALLLVGISWEARRRDAAAAERYLAALR
ncbi:MAG: hypothetical protein JWQ74_2030 [Marmoricola sp.]|nr:hypothetical protein [Marmoricola sp.]